MTEETRYWLLTGEVPTGPATVAEIHAQIAAGTMTWKTKVCRVGDTEWVPFLELSAEKGVVDRVRSPLSGGAAPFSEPGKSKFAENTGSEIASPASMSSVEPKLPPDKQKTRTRLPTYWGLMVMMVISGFVYKEWGNKLLPAFFGPTQAKRKEWHDKYVPNAIASSWGRVTKIRKEADRVVIDIDLTIPIQNQRKLQVNYSAEMACTGSP
ncbi:MAG: GYF domain-containing protein [Gemmataceae bacterium]